MVPRKVRLPPPQASRIRPDLLTIPSATDRLFMDRDPGPAPRLLRSSPFFGSEHGPGGLGIVPTFPISRTHGMNRFVVIAFNLEPDIWGTVIGMGLMTAALVAIPRHDGGGRAGDGGEG